MNSFRLSLLAATILPAVAAGAVYEYFLGHRHDYTGHFLAGYGGTLGTLMVWLRLVPEKFGGVPSQLQDSLIRMR